MGDFKQSDMLYDDGKYYKWTAFEDKDNPFVRDGKEAKELNRTEGYEVLYFINNNLKVSPTNAVKTCQKIEKMIRYNVPSDLKDRTEIVKWIIDNYETTK